MTTAVRLPARDVTVHVNLKSEHREEAWIHLPAPPGGGPERRLGPFEVLEESWSADAEDSRRELVAWLRDLGVVE